MDPRADDGRADGPAAPPERDEPGERRPGAARLARPPSERYRTAAADAARSGGRAQRRGSFAAAAWAGCAAGAAGAALFAGLGGPLSLDVGLLVLAAFVGWETGTGVGLGGGTAVGRRTRLGLALGWTAVALTAGQVGLWLWARQEGGALPLPEHLWTVYGVLLPAEYVLALGAAAWAARRS
ncbi:MAG TPA: hypothetical protein VF763_12665 [Candidatus Limnocylindrales bacterium]